MPFHHGKLVIKVEERRNSAAFWMVSLVICAVMLARDIIRYVHHENNISIVDVLSRALWVEISFGYAMRALRYSEIRENGIYSSFYFYKWSEIQGYSWLSPNAVIFEANAFFKFDRSFEITVKEGLKQEVDEALKRYMG